MIEDKFDIGFTALLALREKQIQQSYRPIIGIHKWFARRPGTIFRSLLLAEFGIDPVSEEFWKGHKLEGVIADPFMGGGTPIYEATRLGFNVIGTDINPMSYWIVRQALGSLDAEAFSNTAKEVIEDVESEIGTFYETKCLKCGEQAKVKYFIWVKVDRCPHCGKDNDLFPGYQLSKADRHPLHVVACHSCGELNEYSYRPTKKQPDSCLSCGSEVYVDGPAKHGKCTCQHCSNTFSYPVDASTAPRHRMWAIEYYCTDCKSQHKGRFFKKPQEEDIARFEDASNLFKQISDDLPIPHDNIPPGDETDRLHRWGYRQYREMFNTRQLVGLGLLLNRILRVKAPEIRYALLTVFSDFLRYQNMLCRYDTYALKCQDIFSVHGFPVGLVQCENNLIGIPSVGSGAYRHFVKKYLKAKLYGNYPYETLHINGRKQKIPTEPEQIRAMLTSTFPKGVGTSEALLLPAQAIEMPIPRNSLAGVFTDPPYFDNVQYAELMDFCFVWLRQALSDEVNGFQVESTRADAELTGNVTRRRGLEHFTSGLSAIFQHYALALMPRAPFVFTYHHNDPKAYTPLVVAILDAGLNCTATLPAPAEMEASIHINGTGSSILDTIFVCRRRDSLPVKSLLTELEKDIKGLEAGGIKPTEGDIRCLTAGHLARMTINELYGSWDSTCSISEKMEKASHLLDFHATDKKMQAAIDRLLSRSEVDEVMEPNNELKRPFELHPEDLKEHIEEMVKITISDLTSEFLMLPKGSGFLDYRDFRNAFNVLNLHTSGFQNFTFNQVWTALLDNSRVFCVLRAMLGMTPPEWADLTKSEVGSDVTQGAARGFDGDCRRQDKYVQEIIAAGRAKKTPQRLMDMVNVAVEYLKKGAPSREEGIIHRMDQFDTRYGLESIRHAAQEHVPYAVLLYERYLGRPFASHRDAVSELVGEVMENAVEDQLRQANIPYRKTKRAERIPGFNQAPDFCIPDEIDPVVIIEAKITSDDGTARDKVTRIIRLALDRDNHALEGRDYQVVACVDGRGFGIRSEDMRQMLVALRGKVFTTATLDQLIQNTRLHDLISRSE